MIARKIIYRGNINKEAISIIYDITRKTEITGQVRPLSAQEIELDLEGDPSMIKLIQHQIERKAKSYIQGKTISQIPYQYFQGITLLP